MSAIDETIRAFESAENPFGYGEEVYNKRSKLTGVVAFTDGSIAGVRYYDKETGLLAKDPKQTSMQDIINESAK